ncbi:MAG: glycosyl hydrolase family 18 protein [bacterium]
MRTKSLPLLPIVLCIFFLVVIVIVRRYIPEKKHSTPQQNAYSHSVSPSPKTSFPPTQSLFIPYWASRISKEDKLYDAYYYFGIRPTKEGGIENEAGYQNIFQVDTIPKQQKKLVLRMLDSSITETLLTVSSAQKTLISELRSILAQKAFSGLILDIEVPFTLQANKRGQITKFVQLICTAIKTDYKTCGMLLYGDFSYRNRPYDLAAIGKITDTILVMAYDFHKAGGEPGPNFPLDRRNPQGEGGFVDYGYDFKTMIQDVVSLVPKDKIEVVFGMYGYDWTLNEQGTPLKIAKALSLKEIEIKLQSPSFAKATKGKQISNSKEKNILYVDEEGRRHVIWYEDEESVAIKTKYLLEQGIRQVSYWAYGYY